MGLPVDAIAAAQAAAAAATVAALASSSMAAAAQHQQPQQPHAGFSGMLQAHAPWMPTAAAAGPPVYAHGTVELAGTSAGAPLPQTAPGDAHGLQHSHEHGHGAVDEQHAAATPGAFHDLAEMDLDVDDVEVGGEGPSDSLEPWHGLSRGPWSPPPLASPLGSPTPQAQAYHPPHPHAQQQQQQQQQQLQQQQPMAAAGTGAAEQAQMAGHGAAHAAEGAGAGPGPFATAHQTPGPPHAAVAAGASVLPTDPRLTFGRFLHNRSSHTQLPAPVEGQLSGQAHLGEPAVGHAGFLGARQPAGTAEAGPAMGSPPLLHLPEGEARPTVSDGFTLGGLSDILGASLGGFRSGAATPAVCRSPHAMSQVSRLHTVSRLRFVPAT